MKKIKLNINNKDYFLSMNRDAIKWLENQGFSIVEFEKKPITYYDMVWQSLFVANHSNDVNPNLALKLMKTYEEDGKNPTQVVKFGIQEYTSFMNALTDINSEKNELEIIED